MINWSGLYFCGVKSTGFRSQLGVMLPNICQLMPLALFLAKISGSTLKIIHYANRGAFAVTHHPVSSWTGGTADRNRSHWSTSKTPSYTKSVSWQHHQLLVKLSPIYLLYNVTLPPSHHRSRMTRYQESKIIACEKLYIRKIILQKHCSSIDRKRTMDQNNILTIKTQAR